MESNRFFFVVAHILTAEDPSLKKKREDWKIFQPASAKKRVAFAVLVLAEIPP